MPGAMGQRRRNAGAVDAEAVPMHGHDYSLRSAMPPLGVLIFAVEG